MRQADKVEPTSNNVTNNQNSSNRALKFKKKSAPKIKIEPDIINDDYIGCLQLLPDYTWTYGQSYMEEVLKFVKPFAPSLTDYMF